MKTLCTILCILFLCHFSQAQYIGDTHIDDIDAHYITMTISSSFSLQNLGLSMTIEYGPKTMSGLRHLTNLRESPKGDVIEFQSRMDGLNYMYENGYELVQAIPDHEGKVQSYILKRRQ